MPPPPGSFEAWERVIAEPVAAPPRRPVAITVAGVLLIVAGGFAALAAGLILLTGDGASIEGVGADAPTVVVLVALALAALEVGAGVLVLRCAPIGRTLGIVVAGARHRGRPRGDRLTAGHRDDRDLRLRGLRARHERRGLPADTAPGRIATRPAWRSPVAQPTCNR